MMTGCDSIATAFEGYPMSKQGRALEALSVATVASAVGGIAGALFLLLLSPPLARLSLRFGPSEYFWVAILGLTLIASLSEGSSMKGMMGGALGMVIGTIGVAPIGGETRFTFGMPVLQGGVAMIVALIGLFVLPELYSIAAKGKTALTAVEVDSKARSSLLQVTRKVFSMPGNLIRSCIIGEIVAIIPGAGGNVANLVAYNEVGNSCSEAVPQLMDGEPAQWPDRYRQGNPIDLLPASVPMVLVHGTDDAIVPLAEAAE